MNDKKILADYTILNDNILYLVEQLNCSYLEALSYVLEILVIEDINLLSIDVPPTIKEHLNAMKEKITVSQENSELIRKVIQLLLLQAIKQDNVQANHQITPDTIAFIISFIIKKIIKTKQINLLDICLGSGNLISVLHEGLKDTYELNLMGSEIDDMLITIADLSLQLQNIDIQLKHQDSIKPLFVYQPNLIVSDLPIGYYPDDDIAKSFQVSSKSEHTYAHHLLIEHSLQLLEKNGWGIFVVPSNLFETRQANKILSLLTGNQYYLQGFLALPKTMFKSKSMQKSLLFVQKAGEHAKKAKTTLLGEIPSLKNPKAMKYFMNEIEKWSQNL